MEYAGIVTESEKETYKKLFNDITILGDTTQEYFLRKNYIGRTAQFNGCINTLNNCKACSTSYPLYINNTKDKILYCYDSSGIPDGYYKEDNNNELQKSDRNSTIVIPKS